MLVLSRRKNQKILIAGNIEITVVGIEGGVVRIGIIAPVEVPITRPDRVEREREMNMGGPES